jgi:hypothetical protein
MMMLVFLTVSLEAQYSFADEDSYKDVKSKKLQKTNDKPNSNKALQLPNSSAYSGNINVGGNKDESSKKVILYRVRYCASPTVNNSNVCPTGKTTDQFKHWKNVDKNVQKNTYLTVLSEPKPEDVETVIFVSAGQQAEPKVGTLDALGEEWGDGWPNVLTGQADNYKDGCKGRTKYCYRYMNSKSLAVKLYRSGVFDLKKTLFIVAFDARFHYEKPSSELLNIENAYWAYFTEKFDPGVVKRIILAGQSRGGCLNFRLARRLRHTEHYDKIPLITQGYDPVCHRNELGKIAHSNSNVTNPFNADYRSIIIQMDKVFPAAKRQHLALLDIHGGGPSIKLTKMVRSFTFKPLTTQAQTEIDLGWWKQKWVNYSHTDMGGNFAHAHETVEPGYQHILQKVALFNTYVPPGPITVANQQCSFPFPKKVGMYQQEPVCTAHLVNNIKRSRCLNRNSPGRVWNGYCLWKKSGYWHARTLKKETSGQLRCSAQFPRRVGDYNGKPVCQAAAALKIKAKNCSKKKGMQWNGYCVWGKKHLWHARKLK